MQMQLGERNAVLFIQDAARAANLNDLPDSFFDLNVNDIKLLIKGLRTQSEGTIEQPLLTAKLREMEEEQKQLVLLNKYKAVIIRIQFPNRYVLQGTFTPYETIKTVMDFVRSYLGNPNIDFYLCQYNSVGKKINIEIYNYNGKISFCRYNSTKKRTIEGISTFRSKLCAISYFTLWFG